MKKIIVFALLFGASFSFAQVADAPENISPLLIGEKMPSVTLQDIEGKDVMSNVAINKKSVIIVYRGGWCPFCNAQLSDMQGIEKEIQDLGYQIVAISPDSPSKLKETVGKDKLNYSLFSDSNGTFSKSVGIAFARPAKYGDMLGEYSDGKNKSFLPVPTVYVVDDLGIIKFLYINPNYKERLKGNLLLAVLKNI